MLSTGKILPATMNDVKENKGKSPGAASPPPRLIALLFHIFLT
jgi:hypothetical protein